VLEEADIRAFVSSDYPRLVAGLAFVLGGRSAAEDAVHGSEWKSLGRLTVGDRNGWFWNVVAGPGGICRLSTSDIDPYPIELRPLVSASLGCSPVNYNFHVDEYGALAPG
jgi:hypothetical protein